MKWLVSRFCPRDMKVCMPVVLRMKVKVDIFNMQLFSYAMDVLLPECVLRLLMDIYNIAYVEASTATCSNCNSFIHFMLCFRLKR